jgi:hypothetical protein
MNIFDRASLKIDAFNACKTIINNNRNLGWFEVLDLLTLELENKFEHNSDTISVLDESAKYYNKLNRTA